MSLALIGVVVVTRLRMTAIALGLLGSSFAIGQASAAMPVNGLAAAEKQISTNVEDVRWAPGHHWHGRHWGWHHPGWLLGMARCISGGGTAGIIGDRIRGTSGSGTPGIDGTGGIAGNRIAERLAARALH